MFRKIVISDEGIFSNGKKYLYKDMETIVYEDTTCERESCCFESTLTIIFKSKKKLEFFYPEIHCNFFDDLCDEIIYKGNFIEDSTLCKGDYKRGYSIVREHHVYIPK